MSTTMERVLLPVMAMALVACGDASGPSRRAGDTRLVLSVSGRPAAAAPQAAPETIGLGSDVLVINQVDLVIREIELERVGRTSGCDTDTDDNDDQSQDGANDKDGDNDDAGDDCEGIEVGPLLLSLALNRATATKVEVPVEPGTYGEVEFEVHKPDDDDSRDRAFLVANPDFRGVSIRARGTFNGTAFDFVTDLNVKQEVTLVPPLVVTEGATVELTLTVDVRAWFLDAAKSKLVNPATALKGQPNENQVKSNIIKSIGAKGDDDQDD